MPKIGHKEVEQAITHAAQQRAGLTRLEVSGKTYDIRDELKRLAFRWDHSEKSWSRYVSDKEIDPLCEKIKDIAYKAGISEDSIQFQTYTD